ncbi:MAG TPA: hypothetical protein VEI94_12025 [Candidatus Bathyarchaeia archaeon]|nr:hypothetical protein [Candidatus Bathyarchaeia archaeon]
MRGASISPTGTVLEVAPARAAPARPRRVIPFAALYAVLLVVLVATSYPRRVGDGAEYLALAESLVRLRSPAPTSAERADLEARLVAAGGGFAGVEISAPQLHTASGRELVRHFWFYPLLAAPLVGLAEVARMHPNYGFAALNLVLLSLAAAAASRRLSWPALLLLFASPIVWWVDKAHTEVFTFSLLAIAFAELEERPWRSVICLGAAATQNPPNAIALGIVLVTSLARRAIRRDVRTWAAAAVALALAALHPLYTWLMVGVGTPTVATGRMVPHLPRLAEAGAFLWDPNIGLAPSFPALPIVVLGAVVALAARAPARLLARDVLVALACGVVFVASFAQTTSLNTGATPGMARYGLWLIPLAIPLLHEADGVLSRRIVAPIALASCLLCLTEYHPAQPVAYLAPTRLASFLWERHPRLENPPPEIFFERLAHVPSRQAPGEPMARIAPIATGSCSKVLLIGGAGPAGCALGREVPPPCALPGAYCYANRSGTGYVFRQVAPPLVDEEEARGAHGSGGPAGGEERGERAWPRLADACRYWS